MSFRKRIEKEAMGTHDTATVIRLSDMQETWEAMLAHLPPPQVVAWWVQADDEPCHDDAIRVDRQEAEDVAAMLRDRWPEKTYRVRPVYA